jgi:peptidoglycan-associated lipoprotein
MKSPRPVAPALLLFTSLLTSGCTAQEIAPKVSNTPIAASASSLADAVPPPKIGSGAAPGDLFAREDHLQTVSFEPAKSQLDPKAQEVLKGNVDWLKWNMPLHIQVAGFSDSAGSPDQNLAVGQRRAAAVRDYYVAMGIPRSRISTISYGQEEPLCFDQTEECRAKNRRVDTLIDNKTLASR